MTIRRAVWVVLGVCSWAAVAAADPPADDCTSAAKAFEAAPSAATEVAVGDCHARLGQREEAARWYRDAARRLNLLAAEASPAPQLVAPLPVEPADHVRDWRAAMWTSLAVTAVGIGVYAYGRAEMNDATSRLCDGGAYPDNPSCGPVSLTAAQVAALNDQGERGQTFSRLGLATGLVGAGAAALSLYEGYYRHEARADRVVIAPVIAPGAGGAQLRLQW